MQRETPKRVAFTILQQFYIKAAHSNGVCVLEQGMCLCVCVCAFCLRLWVCLMDRFKSWLVCLLASLLAGLLGCLLACLLAGLLACLLACWLAGSWLAGWLSGLHPCFATHSFVSHMCIGRHVYLEKPSMICNILCGHHSHSFSLVCQPENSSADIHSGGLQQSRTYIFNSAGSLSRRNRELGLAVTLRRKHLRRVILPSQNLSTWRVNGQFIKRGAGCVLFPKARLESCKVASRAYKQAFGDRTGQALMAHGLQRALV